MSISFFFFFFRYNCFFVRVQVPLQPMHSCAAETDIIRILKVFFTAFHWKKRQKLLKLRMRVHKDNRGLHKCTEVSGVFVNFGCGEHPDRDYVFTAILFE